MADVNYKDAIPTLKDEIEHETVEQVLALDVDKYKYGFETAVESERVLWPLAQSLLSELKAARPGAIRLLGVSLSSLEPQGARARPQASQLAL